MVATFFNLELVDQLIAWNLLLTSNFVSHLPQDLKTSLVPCIMQKPLRCQTRFEKNFILDL